MTVQNPSEGEEAEGEGITLTDVEAALGPVEVLSDDPAGGPLLGDDGRRTVAHRLGEALGWPTMPFKPGHTLLAGREHWVRFLRASPDAEVALLVVALERRGAA